LIDRRDFLLGIGAASLATGFPGRAVTAQARSIRTGYAAITWQGDDERAIREIAQAGFHAIQFRVTAFDRWRQQPGELRDLLARHGLTFAVAGSSSLRIDPAVTREELDTHFRSAVFARDAGGQFLQLIDDKPTDRPLESADYVRLGQLLTEIGRRITGIGISLVYHHRMSGIGETPMQIEAILDSADPRHVGFVLDIGHYHQAGGDPIAAIRRYRERIRVVHLKDVRSIAASPGYQWVELGRGNIDVKGCIAALREIGFSGWAIVELDRVPDATRSETESTVENRKYIEQQLSLEL